MTGTQPSKRITTPSEMTGTPPTMGATAMGAMMKKIPPTMMGRPLMRPLISQLVVVLVLCNILNGSFCSPAWISSQSLNGSIYSQSLSIILCNILNGSIYFQSLFFKNQ
jgi:hypothetical protein